MGGIRGRGAPGGSWGGIDIEGGPDTGVGGPPPIGGRDIIGGGFIVGFPLIFSCTGIGGLFIMGPPAGGMAGPIPGTGGLPPGRIRFIIVAPSWVGGPPMRFIIPGGGPFGVMRIVPVSRQFSCFLVAAFGPFVVNLLDISSSLASACFV